MVNTRYNIGHSEYNNYAWILGDKHRVRIARNTWIERQHSNSIGIVYHYTTIVRYFPNGTVVLNSGGWHSVTTKRRINQFTPQSVSVYQKNWRWIVTVDGQDMPFENDMRLFEPEYVYVVGYSKPGYLCDSSYEYETFTDAIGAIREELEDCELWGEEVVDNYIDYIAETELTDAMTTIVTLRSHYEIGSMPYRWYEDRIISIAKVRKE